MELAGRILSSIQIHSYLYRSAERLIPVEWWLCPIGASLSRPQPLPMNFHFKSCTLLLVCLLAISWPLAAQIISFPDPQFKNALVNTLCVEKTGDYKGDADADTNNDGEIDVNEALAVTRLYVTSQGITSLEGIEYFTNLTLLNADLNQITALDITPLTNLHTLEANNNNIAEIHATNLP